MLAIFSRTWRSVAFLIGCTAVNCSFLVPAIRAQVALDIRPADPIEFPFVIDSNGAAFWRDGKLHIYSSAGEPMLNIFGPGLQHLATQRVLLDRRDHLPMWIESVWHDSDGTVFGWYHHERLGLCPNSSLSVPEIGALVSLDGGKSFIDLGIILASGEFLNCNAQNGYFANGHGDFSVILDRQNEYFYFLFGSYGGDVSAQGVAIARLPFASRREPVGAVQKYHQQAWLEPGLGGRVTPIFGASVSWHEANTDSFWGPSIHWNTYLQRFVVLMNRSCCSPRWPQEGVYITMNENLTDPAAWTEPVKIIEYGDWYPWVMALEGEQPNAEAGQQVRLFVRGSSDREIIFRSNAEEPGQQADPAAPPGTRYLIPPR
jgi:hypothetical protein